MTKTKVEDIKFSNNKQAKSEFEHYFYKRKPVIIKEYVNTWPCFDKWSISYFETLYADEKKSHENVVDVSPLPYGLSFPPNILKKTLLSKFLKSLSEQELRWKTSPHHRNPDFKDDSMKETIINKRKLLENYKPSDKEFYSDPNHPYNKYTCDESHIYYYLQQYPIAKLPSISKDIPSETLLDEFEESLFASSSLFIGTSGLRTSIHYDQPLVENLFCQLEGQKRIRLWHPTVKFDTFSGVYAHVALFPELEDCPVKPTYDIVLNRGDVLYIPKGWWHHVESLSRSISLNFWYY
mmetsp:Transcript_8298/g.12293  ORF Transcript_8298/g.12293 Transcript_8298/m.12293 type:complete len:294 (-) Transcript_8298:17-898(-)